MKRKIVCLCGSTRYRAEFMRANHDESLAGNVVLTVAWFSHADGSTGEENEKKFRQLHFDKIDMADEILVVNVDGYVGEHTKAEIDYAERIGKPIRYLVEPHREV